MSFQGGRFHYNKEAFFKSLGLMLLDAVMIICCMAGALWLRFDFSFTAIDPEFLQSVHTYMWINVVCTIIVNIFCKMYKILWRFASIIELRSVAIAVFASSFIQFCGMRLMKLPVPRSYILIYVLLFSVYMILSRYSFRFIGILLKRSKRSRANPVITMVVGAGSAGYMLVHEMKSSPHINRKVPCIIDDNAEKWGTYLLGVPVVGGKKSIPAMVKKYDVSEIIIAIPTLTPEEQSGLLEICQETASKVLLLPSIYQLVNQEVTVSMLREVKIEDLLGRDSIQLRMDKIAEYISGNVIMVTGGGGSIGSELCRQIALHKPRQLIIVDIYENNAYNIQMELKRNYPDLNLVTLIASVRDRKRIDSIFAEYRPDIVYHAAAHKHVPLTEDSPNEAIKNNVLGTYIVAQAADEYKVKRMVLISSDKAVRPTNVMGASKRICEIIMQVFNQISDTEYAAVRFGNVLGSNGSVFPLFNKQIKEGGPVTVTHPDIIRYFMTILEAVNLVLQCGAYAHGGEIFILDMGEPVKILDMAKKMIRLSGHIPDKDIKIKFTGLRPGEKLYEELLIDEKNLVRTENERIFVAQMGKIDAEKTRKQLLEIVNRAYEEADDIRSYIKEMVPEYKMWQGKSSEEVYDEEEYAANEEDVNAESEM